MEDAKSVMRRSVRLLVGNVVGVGMFGLPYVFAQAGFGVATIAFAVSWVLSLVVLFMYGDMVLLTKGRGRFVGIVRDHAGPLVGALAAVGFFGSLFGAMTAYIIVGGTFAHTLFAPFIGGTLATFRVVFFVVAAFGVLAGSMMVGKLQRLFITAYTALIVVLALVATPYADLSHFVFSHDGTSWIAPFGVALFAFTGFGAVPEMRDALGRHKHLLRRALVIGMLLIAALYAVFTTAVVGVTGLATTPEALKGLSELLGPAVLLIGSAIGLCTVMTAFLAHGVVMTNTWVYDYRLRYLVGWCLAVLLPFAVFLLGATDFIRVIEVTGGLGIGLCGLCTVFAYEAMRRHPSIAKRMLAIPQPLVLLTGVMFLVNMVLPFIG